MSPLRNSKKGCSGKNNVRFPELILLHRSLKEEKKKKRHFNFNYCSKWRIFLQDSLI